MSADSLVQKQYTKALQFSAGKSIAIK